MNQLDNTTAVVLIICSTITVIAVLWALIWAIAWFAANKWRHYYRGLQKQIVIESDALMEDLDRNDSSSVEAEWVAAMLIHVARNRTLPTRESRTDNLKWFQGQNEDDA